MTNWDHRTGYFPSGEEPPEMLCAFAFPVGESTDARRHASPFGLVATAGEGVPKRLDTGEWYRVRLQIFPDGRCGIALNGHAVFIGAASVAPRRPVHLLLQGSSVGTRMLVGRVWATEGVPGDVDWRRLRRVGDVWMAAGRTK